MNKYTTWYLRHQNSNTTELSSVSILWNIQHYKARTLSDIQGGYRVKTMSISFGPFTRSLWCILYKPNKYRVFDGIKRRVDHINRVDHMMFRISL